MNYIEVIFPNVINEGYQITSPDTQAYNCIAWAAEDSGRWWWPDPTYQAYWPADIPINNSLESFILLFEQLGYQICHDGNFENGFQKVAIYIDHSGVTHAARQLDNGKWTSKLGDGHDIEHTLLGLVSTKYGSVGKIMRRNKVP